MVAEVVVLEGDVSPQRHLVGEEEVVCHLGGCAAHRVLTVQALGAILEHHAHLLRQLQKDGAVRNRVARSIQYVKVLAC